jgi:hypothetical protein
MQHYGKKQSCRNCPGENFVLPSSAATRVKENARTRGRREYNTSLNLFAGALNLVAQHDGFGDFAHGLSSLAALTLES